MKIIVGAGHRPGGLLNLWRPISWMPAVMVLRDRIIEDAVDTGGTVEVLSGMDIGFGLMLAGAALMAKDQGYNVRLVAVPAYSTQFDAFHQNHAATNWYHKAMARADDVKFSRNQRPIDRKHAEHLQKERTQWMVEWALSHDNKVMLAAYNGKPGNETAHAVAYAERRNLEVENVFTDVIAVLGRSERAAG
jgi:hypothetical protein